jgi:serine/threonine-protein kinase
VPPEVLRGKPASVQSDLYGVGVCMWETLAGRKLFEAATDMQVMFLVNDAVIPDLHALRPDIPSELREILSIALSREPSSRFGSAHLMARKLAELLRTSDEPTDARRIAGIVRSARERLGATAPESATTESATTESATTQILDDLEELP